MPEALETVVLAVGIRIGLLGRMEIQEITSATVTLENVGTRMEAGTTVPGTPTAEVNPVLASAVVVVEVEAE